MEMARGQPSGIKPEREEKAIRLLTKGISDRLIGAPDSSPPITRRLFLPPLPRLARPFPHCAPLPLHQATLGSTRAG